MSWSLIERLNWIEESPNNHQPIRPSVRRPDDVHALGGGPGGGLGGGLGGGGLGGGLGGGGLGGGGRLDGGGLGSSAAAVISNVEVM